ncbi:hypothetical protein BDV95DRAFT_604141 [Massariosphaeria phaeospora]|uniref:Uncharacterized protein n=1 Tax=Massariosphaeria phaeospora TaxID=100035 RepID=A0A7C8IBJ7_9PLEO|nr:hypothetical protein BDV95DRAFT_604141 [Massariosphaeria phaeospora]
MKSVVLAFIALAALLQAVQAGTVVFIRVGLGGTGVSGNAEGWQAYSAFPACKDALEWMWVDTEDASGYGVRCEGDGCDRNDESDPTKIEVLEMNFDNGANHWTYYKNRDGALVTVKGKKVGTCAPVVPRALDCGLTIGKVVGYSKLRCEIDGVSAEKIESLRKD